jgi:hypothetical protein
MISPELLIPIMLVTLCTVTTLTVSYFTSRIQSSSDVLRVVLGALILTMIAALPTLTKELAPELSADPLREQGKVHASRP